MVEPKILTLWELLSGRLFNIPQYQRSYSWEKKHRRNLFDDIKKSYSKEKAPHFMSTVVGLERGKENIWSNVYKKIDIVDGQQRITTLILLFKAISKELDRSIDEEKATGEEIDKILVKPNKLTTLLLQTNHDQSEHFANYIRWEKYNEEPNSAEILADRELLLAIKECEVFVKRWKDKGNSLMDLCTHLKNQLLFIFYAINDEGLVYSVFEVLNSRGLPVSWFDRLKSMLMAVVFEQKDDSTTDDTIAEIHRLYAKMYRIIGLRLGLSTESLRFAATLRSDSSPSRPLSEEDAVQLLFDQSEDNPHSVIKTANWIKSVTEAVDKLTRDHRRNAVTRIAQARLVAVAINLRSEREGREGRTPLTENEMAKLLRRWENVTFRIYGLYSKDARTAVGDYVRLAWRIENDQLSFDDIMKGLSEIGERYPPDEAAKELKKINCYDWGESLRYFFRRYEEYLGKKSGQSFDNEQWNRIWESSVSDSIEHIQPQNTGVRYVHWLGNLMILPPGLNSELRDAKPKEKASAYEKMGLLMAQEVAKQISTHGKWTEAMVIEREKKLIEWAAKEWADCGGVKNEQTTSKP